MMKRNVSYYNNEIPTLCENFEVGDLLSIRLHGKK